MAMRGNGKDSLDTLIARGLGMSITDAAGGCPDADVLAAFASHALSTAEYSHWESHVAGCGRCQREVAALARSGLSLQDDGADARRTTADRGAQAATIAAISEDDESTYHAIRKSTSEIIENIRSAMRFMLGPFPLSVTIHVALILFLIITVHQQRGRELIMVNLEAGGGGGGGSEMNDLDLPEVPMPDTAPQQMDQPNRSGYFAGGRARERLPYARRVAAGNRNRSWRRRRFGIRQRHRFGLRRIRSESCAARASMWCMVVDGTGSMQLIDRRCEGEDGATGSCDSSAGADRAGRDGGVRRQGPENEHPAADP